jgi:hypothetical protein
MARSLVRGANLRAWLNRTNCPQIIKEFKMIFDKFFSTKDPNLAAMAPQTAGHEHAHFTLRGITYSRASAHVGNSLVSYLPPSSVDCVAGSIQKITTSGDSVVFSIKRQAPLPANAFDPFIRFNLLRAKSYSSKMSDGPDDVVPPTAILNHVARYNYSNGRAVILNLSKVGLKLLPRITLIDFRFDSYFEPVFTFVCTTSARCSTPEQVIQNHFITLFFLFTIYCRYW